ncbi:MAG: radical SAM protein [Nitrospinota bacterium]
MIGQRSSGKMQIPWVRGALEQAHRRVRLGRMLVKALVSTRHPILVQLVVTRRCNLSCAYCNEYDQVSDPVRPDTLFQRIDRLASLGTSVISLTGGEPLVHPKLEGLVARIRRHGIFATVITNGYLLTENLIKRLNSARLDYLHISIDNVTSDEVSMKSLNSLDRKLDLLSRFAAFGVNVNSVIGAGIKNPEDALVVDRRARELGFATSLGILHDGTGQVKPLSESERRVYRTIKKNAGGSFALTYRFQENLARGRPNRWRCRAGARYLYVDEFGLVHLCSQQRGYPAMPLERYSQAEMRREYLTEKPCAPYCTLPCVHRASMIDSWRHRQTGMTPPESRYGLKGAEGLEVIRPC